MAESKSTTKETTKSKASSPAGKHDEHHTIGDKLHNLADEIKDRAHHLAHGDDSKSGKDLKKTTTTKTKEDHDKKPGSVSSPSAGEHERNIENP